MLGFGAFGETAYADLGTRIVSAGANMGAATNVAAGARLTATGTRAFGATSAAVVSAVLSRIASLSLAGRAAASGSAIATRVAGAALTGPGAVSAVPAVTRAASTVINSVAGLAGSALQSLAAALGSAFGGRMTFLHALAAQYAAASSLDTAANAEGDFSVSATSPGATLGGHAQATGTGGPQYWHSGSFGQIANLVFRPFPRFNERPTFTVNARIASTGRQGLHIAGALAGRAALVARGLVTAPVARTFAAIGDLATAGVRRVLADAELAGSGALAAAESVTLRAVRALGAAAAFAATAVAGRLAAGAFAGAGGLAGLVYAAVYSVSSLPGLSGLAANFRQIGRPLVTLRLSAGFAGLEQSAQRETWLLAVTAALQGADSVNRFAAAGLSGGARIVATIIATRTAAGDLAGRVGIAVNGVAVALGAAASLGGRLGLSFVAGMAQRVTGALAAAGAAAAVSSVARAASAAIGAANAAVTAEARRSTAVGADLFRTVAALSSPGAVVFHTVAGLAGRGLIAAAQAAAFVGTSAFGVVAFFAHSITGVIRSSAALFGSSGTVSGERSVTFGSSAPIGAVAGLAGSTLAGLRVAFAFSVAAAVSAIGSVSSFAAALLEGLTDLEVEETVERQVEDAPGSVSVLSRMARWISVNPRSGKD